MGRRILPFLAAQATALAGCGRMNSLLAPHHPREEAKARWADMRARIKLQLAESEFKAGHLEQSLKSLDEVLQLEPSNARATLLLARVRLEAGQLAAARAAALEAMQLLPGTAEPAYVAGMIAERAEAWTEALKYYTVATDLAPDDPDYLAARIEAMMAFGQSAEALALLDSRIGRFQDEPRLRYLAAEIYRSMGQNGLAARQLRIAARRGGESSALQDDLGEALADAGRDAEAVGVLKARERSADRAGQTAEEKDAGGATQRRLTLARSYIRLGRADDARRVLKELLESKPDQAAGWLLLARVESDAANWPAARDAAEHAARLAPDQDAGHLLCAYARLQTGDARGAADAARRAIDANPRNAIAYCTLGQALEALQQRERAREAYAQALVVDPDCSLARELLRRAEVAPPPDTLKKSEPTRSALRPETRPEHPPGLIEEDPP